MAEETIVRQIVQVQAEEVIQKINKGFKVYAFQLSNGSSLDLDNKTLGQIRNMTNDTSGAYLFFVIKEITG